MALPSNGKISLNDVRTELGITGPVSLGDSKVRGLAGITSGKISMNDLYGKQVIVGEEFTMLPQLFDGEIAGFIDSFMGSITPQALKNGAFISTLITNGSEIQFQTSKITNYPNEYIITANDKSCVVSFDSLYNNEPLYKNTNTEETKNFFSSLSSNINKEVKIRIGYK